MAASTAIDLMTRSVEELRVGAIGEPYPDGRSEGDLVRLNAYLESLSIEGLMIVADNAETVSLTEGNASYTWGIHDVLNAVIDTPRPIEMKYDCFIRVGSTDHPVLLKTRDFMRGIPNKLTRSRPRYFSYIDSFPFGELILLPVPDQDYTFFTRVTKQLGSFKLLTTEVELPPGYELFLIYNFAIKLAPSYGKRVSNELAVNAKDAKDNIERQNVKPIQPVRLEIARVMNRGRYGGRSILDGPY